MMRYTVKEVAALTGVTIKALHHYHKIGLLVPHEVTAVGYRLYGIDELKRLQQILFYRELDFSLQEIQQALTDETSRIDVLTKQQELLINKQKRTEQLLQTIADSIKSQQIGHEMEELKMFNGLNKEQWQQSLAEQKEYLLNNYQYEMDTDNINVDELNALADEPERFMSQLAVLYRQKSPADDNKVQELLKSHIAYINDSITPTDASSFVDSAKFFMDDDFHRGILESREMGLSYFLYAASIKYAECSN
ncbi:MerR family transcriptional regulator [Paenibacillaceae bacterium]|nr:MerR family transcriptional regulator [Paenibacillaceae bacterium]